MTDGFLGGSRDDFHVGLDSSLEPHFASLLSRHREAAAKSEWSYQQRLSPVRPCRRGCPAALVLLGPRSLDHRVSLHVPETISE
jgi:hypothetical protein